MSDLNKEVVDLVWGRQTSSGMTDALFRRWTQGFVFSEAERTALEQFEGGPCAVIAPVQAFLMKNILFNCERSNWRDISDEEQKTALCYTLTEILETACFNKSESYCLATWSKAKISDENSDIPDSHPEPSRSSEGLQPPALAAEEIGFERFHSVVQEHCGSLTVLFATPNRL